MKSFWSSAMTVLVMMACLLCGLFGSKRASAAEPRLEVKPLTAASSEVKPLTSGYIGWQKRINRDLKFYNESDQLVGGLKVKNLFGPTCHWWSYVLFNVQEPSNPWKQNEFKTGFDFDVAQNLTLYSFWERKYSSNQNFYIVGARFNFGN